MFDVVRHVVQDLPSVSLEQRQAWLLAVAEPGGADQHPALMRQTACLNAVRHELRGPCSPLTFPIRLAAWNLERCYDVPGSFQRLCGHDVVLLSEMDVGMARTGQVDTVAELSRLLEAEALFAVEFIELGLGSPKEAAWVAGQNNVQGWHGNAVLARSPMSNVRLWRLDGDGGRWYTTRSPEVRVGGRCAVGACVQTTQGPLWLVSVHLEYSGTPAERAHDLQSLLEALQDDIGEDAVVVGGDFNTFQVHGADLSGEPLFELAAARGYQVHAGAHAELTVRPSRVSDHPGRYRLDWIFTKGVHASGSEVLPAVDGQGQPLSDHEIISLSIEGLSRA